VRKLTNLQKVDLRKSPLKLWTCKRLKFNQILAWLNIFYMVRC